MADENSISEIPPAMTKKKKSGVVVPHSPNFFQRLGAWLVFILLRLFAATLRYKWIDHSEFFYDPKFKAAIYCVWHNRLVLSMESYRLYARKRKTTSGMAALVSASRDGGFLAGILERFNVQPVRGSSSRRGPQALLELTGWAERGYDLAITPDGPRGPRYVVQDGVMSLAQLTGLSIIPFSFHAKWKICLKSWDRFQIPLPFSCCEMNIGKPVFVPREATDAEREELRQRLETELRAISRD
jgi:lysophospholipid acyltransferase (LPLAT)-like uncharacterized protein